MLVLLVNEYWAFSEFMIRQAVDVETAALWNKILFLWPFMVPLMLHFSLVFVESDLAKKKVTYALLYVPALIFSAIDSTTNWISLIPVKQPWGYSQTYAIGSWICHLDGIWAATLSLLAVFILFVYYYRVSDKTRKQQAKYVGVGLAIPVSVSIITDSVFPVIGIQFPGLGSIFGAALSGFVVYAIWKYDLFAVNPAVAAQNIVSAMPDSLVLADSHGKILSVNRSLLEFFGYQENELIGKPLTEIQFEKGTRAKIHSELQGKSEIKNMETKCLTKAGVEKTVTISGSLIKNKRGQDVGFNCIIHDITHQKQMERQLLEAQKYAAIGELAGMVGHDLRNPLTSMRAAVYYLKTKHSSKLDNKDKLMLESIEKSIDYSNKIITDLLDYSREIRLKPESATPKSLIENAFLLVQTPQNVKIVDASEDTYAVQADKTHMVRVFVNLVTNAFDAMPDGGTLTIKSQNLGDHVALSFEDTGSGMTPETLRKLWTPLFTTKAKGMGFGLAICKRIVEAHGGRIWAESTIGKGTTINIAFPLCKKPDP
jgi:PAS domain S-box-containing protein